MKAIYRLATVASAAIFIVSAHAQNSGTVSNHAVPVGKGAGKQGFTSAAPGTVGFPLTSNGASSDPSFQVLPITGGGTGQGTAALGITALLPTATRAGDIIYWDGTNWNHIAGNNSGTQIFTENASGVPAWAAAGSVSSVTCGTGLSGGTITTSGTCALALTNATFQGNPSSYASITSTTSVMVGAGSTCKLTPIYSGRVRVDFLGQSTNNTAPQRVTAQAAFGTGAAPIQGAAGTGTTIDQAKGMTSASAGAFVPFVSGGIVTGLTPGTAYWFDLQTTVTANTGTLSALSCTIMEF